VKKVVLTGGTGFVGANLARRLLHDGHDVHLLVQRGYTRWRLDEIRRDIHVHEVALADESALTRVLRRVRPDWIFHLAAHGAYSWQTDVDRIVQTNLLGTIALVQAALRTGFEAFVNTGSSSEYGFKDHAPAEDEWADPNSHYAVTKASATMFCRYTAVSRRVLMPTLRLYSVYGPYEDPMRLMPTVALRGLDGTFPPLTRPDTARDYVHVDDVCEAYVLAATRRTQEPGAVYNVGSGVQTTLRQVIDVARREFGIADEPVWGGMADRSWDTSVWVADPRRIGSAIGWRATLDFAQGFHRMANWFRESPAACALYRSLRGETPAVAVPRLPLQAAGTERRRAVTSIPAVRFDHPRRGTPKPTPAATPPAPRDRLTRLP